MLRKKQFLRGGILMLAILLLGAFMLRDTLSEKQYVKKFTLRVKGEGLINPSRIINKVFADSVHNPQHSATHFGKNTYVLNEEKFFPESTFIFSEEAIWVVELPHQNDESQAQKLVSLLQKEGYRAYEKNRSTEGTPLYQVYVGPLVSEDEAQKTAKLLQEQHGLNATLRNYSPVEQDS